MSIQLLADDAFLFRSDCNNSFRIFQENDDKHRAKTQCFRGKNNCKCAKHSACDRMLEHRLSILIAEVDERSALANKRCHRNVIAHRTRGRQDMPPSRKGRSWRETTHETGLKGGNCATGARWLAQNRMNPVLWFFQLFGDSSFSS